VNMINHLLMISRTSAVTGGEGEDGQSDNGKDKDNTRFFVHHSFPCRRTLTLTVSATRPRVDEYRRCCSAS